MLMCRMTWQLMWPRVDVELHDDDMRPELCEACEKAVSLDLFDGILSDEIEGSKTRQTKFGSMWNRVRCVDQFIRNFGRRMAMHGSFGWAGSGVNGLYGGGAASDGSRLPEFRDGGGARLENMKGSG
uniref:Uncharacterized protein n=1 Tax=Fagus sylvatica TaxID=28930 RepID=A0A2N9G3P8_FAGSY